MCGFTGFWDFKALMNKQEMQALCQTMAHEIKERGPDSEGVWADETLGLGFGYRRLAIIDLSAAGDQPMISPSGKMVFIYNGEIFNAHELRQELIAAGCQFRGHSDTEVILQGCEIWGVYETCQKIIGMFAFALWDYRQRKLFLVRDRLGIKPLYWGFSNGILFFGSQPKSFFKHPKFHPEINKEALTAYFRFNYVPAPYSIFKDIKKATPGSILVIDEKGHCEEKRFWCLDSITKQAKEVKLDNICVTQSGRMRSDKEMIDELDHLLQDAVKRRMISDVPLGAFLSGGVDSSTVVALMQKISSTPVKTFSIGFFEEGYDEAHHAAKVAAHLGTDHHELYVDFKAAQDIIPQIPHWYDEPFADASQIPTFLVSRLARQHVTVSLSGDGGDELFAGYSRYLFGDKIWRWIENCPLWLRNISAKSIRVIHPHHWDRLAGVLPNRLRPSLVGDKAHKLAELLTLPSRQAFYQKLVSLWESPEALVQDGKMAKLSFWDDNNSRFNFVENMQFMDTLTYLPDDILTKVDRASMGVSLEARVPLLDHRVVEFAWGLPMNAKIRHGKSKWLLRQVLNRYVPQSLIERPKMGFGVPIDQWLRGPLKDFAEYHLSEEQLKKSDLHAHPIRQRFQEHLKGTRNWQYSLWGVLMYQSWKAHWKF